MDLAQTISEKEKSLDMLISNAGIRRDPPQPCNVLSASLEDLQASMWSSKAEDWEQTFAVNTTAHYFLSVALLPLLAAAADQQLGDGMKGRDEGRGVMVIMSSCASMHNVTNVDLTSYATSKAATDHLVKLLAAKYNRFYVRVVGMNPGCELQFDYFISFLTELSPLVVPSNMNPVGAEGNIFSALFDKVPAKRAGSAEDLAGTVLYLVSKAGVSLRKHLYKMLPVKYPRSNEPYEFTGLCRRRFAMRGRWPGFAGERTGMNGICYSTIEIVLCLINRSRDCRMNVFHNTNYPGSSINRASIRAVDSFQIMRVETLMKWKFNMAAKSSFLQDSQSLQVCSISCTLHSYAHVLLTKVFLISRPLMRHTSFNGLNSS